MSMLSRLIGLLTSEQPEIGDELRKQMPNQPFRLIRLDDGKIVDQEGDDKIWKDKLLNRP